MLRRRRSGAEAGRMADTQELSILEAMRDPANRADPSPFYKSLLEKGPLLRLPFGAYALTRHADCFNVLRDARFSSSDEHKDGYENIGEMIKQLGYEDLLGLMTRIMLFADP